MRREGNIGNLWLISFLADFLAVVAAYYTAYFLRFHSLWGERLFNKVNLVLRVDRLGHPGETLEGFYIASAARIVLYIVLTLSVLYALNDLYSGRRFIRKRPVAWNIIVANAIALLMFYAYFYLRRNVFHPRSFFVTVLVLNVFFCIVLRSAVDHLLRALRSKYGIDQFRAVLVGRNGSAELIAKFIQSRHPHGIDIVYRMEFNSEQPFDITLRTFETVCGEHRAEMVILADKRFTVAQVMQVLELSDKTDVSVKVLSDKMDVLMSRARMPVDIVDGLPLVHFDAPSEGRQLTSFRRAVSLVFACLLMVVAVPAMAVIALLIKLTSRGVVFFIQERIGVNRKPFKMYKFRTMRHKSDEMQAQVEEFNESGVGLFKIRKDPRVTRLGSFLRRFSLDELPQLVNVIVGKMTIVGPRPLPRRDFENYYEEWHYSRHSGLPGLTCLWQVSGRSEIDFHNMCILDVYYLRNQSWVLDVKILLRTFWVVLFAKGAY